MCAHIVGIATAFSFASTSSPPIIILCAVYLAFLQSLLNDDGAADFASKHLVNRPLSSCGHDAFNATLV